jgi:hypothetical protein
VESLEKLGSAQMALLCMCNACWITKATNTLSEYVTVTVFPVPQWLHEHASMSLFTYIASLVQFSVQGYELGREFRH